MGNNIDFVRALYDHGAQGSFDAVGVHTDTACLVERPGRLLPRRAGPDRPLHVLRLPRGPRGDERPRRRREADLDDRAGLEHAGDGSALVQRRRLEGQEAARRVARAAGALPARRLPLPRRRPVRRPGVLVRDAGHRGLAVRRRLRALRPRAARASASAKAFRRLDRGIRARRGCGGAGRPHAAGDQRARARGRRALLRQAVRARPRVGPRRHRAAADLPRRRRAARPHVGRHRRLDRPVVGDREVEARPAHADLPRARQRAQRDDGDRHGGQDRRR